MEPYPAPATHQQLTAMCGRYALYADKGLVEAMYGLDTATHYDASYNVAPSQDILAVTADATGRHADLYRWGLVPFWAKEIGKYSTINARAETVASKPVYRAAFKAHRCLIPANGYYEWQMRPGGKQPYFIHAVDDDLLSFAGVWDRWSRPDGTALLSAAIIVTEASADTRPIHDRMPAILPRETWQQWLDPENRDTATLQSLLRPTPPGALACRPVSTRVNSPRHNGPELLARQGAE